MIGQQVLLYFAILLFIIYATVYFGVRRKQERMFAVMAAAWVVIIDQYVKRAVVQALDLGETAELLPGLLRLERVHNYGAAWSSFSPSTSKPRPYARFRMATTTSTASR